MGFRHRAVTGRPIWRGGLWDGSKPAPFDSPAIAGIQRALGSIGRFQQSFGARVRNGERAGFSYNACSDFAIVPGWGKLPVLVWPDLLETGKHLP